MTQLLLVVGGGKGALLRNTVLKHFVLYFIVPYSIEYIEGKM